MDCGIGLLGTFWRSIDFRQRSSEVHQGPLVAVARRVQEAAEQFKRRCFVAHFLAQLSRSRAASGLSCDIACSRRDLELPASDRGSILLNQDHVIIGVESDDGDCTLVADYLSVELFTSVCHEEAFDAKDVSGEEGFDLGDLEAVHRVLSGRNRDRAAVALGPRLVPRPHQADP